jgi:hypothetical protein
VENAMPVDANDEFKPSKREIKRRLKAQKAMKKDLALKIKVVKLKKTTGASDK